MREKSGISVIIPSRNGKHLLEENLPSLLEAMDCSGREYQVIVVDDASADGTAEFLNRTFPSIQVIQSTQNQGFSRSVNSGVFQARYDLVLLLNSDMKVERDFLSPLLCYFDDERTFAVSNKAMKDEKTALTRPHTLQFKFGFLREVYRGEEDKPSFAFGSSGGHGLFDRKKFLELGGFDELFRPFYYEDADLSYRAWKRGYRIYYEPNSIVYHAHQATIGKMYGKGYITFVFDRNKLIFIWKNFTDFNLLLQHVLFLPAYLIWNSIKRPLLLLSFFAAFLKLPLIARARRSERKYIRFRDRDVFRTIRDGFTENELEKSVHRSR